MTENEDPQAIQFGAELRRLRESAGLNQETLGRQVNVSKAMISAIERGTRRTKTDIIVQFDDVLSTGGVLRRFWDDLVRGREVPEWFGDVLEVERRATEIRAFDPQVLPGLLQSYPYALALTRAWNFGKSDEYCEGIARARVDRLPRIAGANPVLRFVVPELVITDIVGSRVVMKEQLGHVMQLIEQRTIRFQVIRRSAHGPHFLPLKIATLSPERAVAHVEHALGGTSVDDPQDVAEIMGIFEEVQAAALPPWESAEFVKNVEGAL